MGSLFGGSGRTQPAATPPAPTRSDQAVQDQADRDRRKAYAASGGIANTYLTGGTGVDTSAVTSVASKFLGSSRAM